VAGEQGVDPFPVTLLPAEPIRLLEHHVHASRVRSLIRRRTPR